MFDPRREGNSHKGNSHKGIFHRNAKRKMATHRVATAPIRVILCAQKATCLGYMLARPLSKWRSKTDQTWFKHFSKKSLVCVLLGKNKPHKHILCLRNVQKRWETFGAILCFFGAPLAPGWPETDSPRKMMANSGVHTQIRALGTRFVAIFVFESGTPKKWQSVLFFT